MSHCFEICFRKLLSRDWHLISFITLFAIVLWWTLIWGIWSRYAIDIWDFFFAFDKRVFQNNIGTCVYGSICEYCQINVFCCDYWVSELLHGGNFRHMSLSTECAAALLPFRYASTINIITTYYTKGVLKLDHNFKMSTNEILKYYHDVLFNKKSVINLFFR